MVSNAESFLNNFNQIEKYLQDKFNDGNYMPFRDLVRQISYKNGIIKRFKSDLYMFGDLRNVLVHNNRVNGKIIAEPVDEIVKKSDFIIKQIKFPEKVEKFKKKVYYCFMDDKLSKALQFFRNYKISQIPIIENNKIVDVLNGNHIAIWLATNSNEDISEAYIFNILKCADRRFNFEIIPEDLPIYEAAEIYKKSFQKPPLNWYYDALIITQKGMPEEQIKGIIVLKDIAEYMHD